MAAASAASDGEKGVAELELKPKKLTSDWKRLVLVIDRDNFQIRETRLTDPVGDTSIITFTETQYEKIQNPEWFDKNLLENTKVD